MVSVISCIAEHRPGLVVVTIAQSAMVLPCHTPVTSVFVLFRTLAPSVLVANSAHP
jgi:hypothetical protein